MRKKFPLLLTVLAAAALLAVTGCSENGTGNDDDGGSGNGNPLLGFWKTLTPANRSANMREGFNISLNADGTVHGTRIWYDCDATSCTEGGIDSLTGGNDIYSVDGNGYLYMYTDIGTGTDRDVDDGWYKYAVNGDTMTWDWAVVLTGGWGTLTGGTWRIIEAGSDSTGMPESDTISITFVSSDSFMFAQGGDTMKSFYELIGTDEIAMQMENLDTMNYSLSSGKLYVYDPAQRLIFTRQDSL